MAHFKKLPQKKNEDKIIYGDKIVDGIVFLALSDMTYAKLYSVNPRSKNHSKAITVYQDKDDVYIDVCVKVHFSQCVSDIAFKIQETVRYNVEAMTEYHVAEVNVIVKGVFFGPVKPNEDSALSSEADDKVFEGEETSAETAKDTAAEATEQHKAEGEENV